MSLRMTVILALTGVLITHWFSRGELQGSDDKSAAAKTVEPDAVNPDGAKSKQPEPET